MVADQGWQQHLRFALETAPRPQQPIGAVCLEACPEPLALLRLQRGVPDCVRSASKNGHFSAVVQEPSTATAWVPRKLLPRPAELADKEGAEEAEAGVGWAALYIGRPGSGSGGLKVPAAPGTAGTLCALLAEVPLGAKLLSATGTEILLLREASLCMAAAVLVTHGHALWPSQRICDPRPWEVAKTIANQSDVLQQQAGAWSLVQREQPLGTIIEDHTEGDGPVYLLSRSGFFVEVRMPSESSGSSEQKQASSAGRLCVSTAPDGQVLNTQLRHIDFQPPSVFAPQSQVTLSAQSMELVEHPHRQNRELWARLQGGTSDADSVLCSALELQSVVPESDPPLAGIWIFVGNRFARVTGFARGNGLVASTCCRSLVQLSRLRGQDVQKELSEHYEAITGTVEKPGLLRILKRSGQPKASGGIFFNSLDESRGEVVVGKECIVHILPNGRRETWRILEWMFDPFTPIEPSSEAEVEAAPPSTRMPQEAAAKVVEVESAGAGEGAEVDAGGDAAGDDAEPVAEENAVARSMSPSTKKAARKDKKEKKEKKDKGRKKDSAKTDGNKKKSKRKGDAEEEAKALLKRKKKKAKKNQESSDVESPLPELEDPEDDDEAPVLSDNEEEQEAGSQSEGNAVVSVAGSADASDAEEEEEVAEAESSPEVAASPSPPRKAKKKRAAQDSTSPPRKRRRKSPSPRPSPAKPKKKRQASRRRQNGRSERQDKARKKRQRSESS